MKYVEEVYDTMCHCVRVGELAYWTAHLLGKPEFFCKEMALAGMLHDIGKIRIDQDVLNKPQKLSEAEFETIKTHVSHSTQMMANFPFSEGIVRAIGHHHEASDGSGYPKGLTGDDISLEGRIIKVCDVYDALTMDRPYRRQYSTSEALAIMQKDHMLFDKDILTALKALIESQEGKRFGFHKPTILVRRTG